MIIHVDMDAYYAAIEQRDDAQLRHKPVIVGGAADGRGVVCAASYEAREYGVHSAMPAMRARRLCPHAVFLSPRMSHYAEISRHIREIFFRYTPLVEPLSLDEAFLDATGSVRLFGSPEEIGRQIKRDILQELRLVASVGIGPNKFLAKIASDQDKPDGFVVVPPDGVHEFLDPLPVSRLWGIGKATMPTFLRMGIRTIGQLRKRPLEHLKPVFGDHAEHVHRLAHGTDDRPVVPDRNAKSISHETTLAVDLRDDDVIRTRLLELADQVGRRLRRHKLQGRTVHLKIRFHDFRTVTRSMTLSNPTCVSREIYDAAEELYDQRIARQDDGVRLVGVGVSHITSEGVRQKTLFDEESHETNRRADVATDAIRDRFGTHALRRASGLSASQKPPKDSQEEHRQDRREGNDPRDGQRK